MKFFPLFWMFLIVLLMNPFILAGDFTWITPLPQGNTLIDVQFLNSQTGYAVGDASTLLKTSDGGNTWVNLRGDSADVFYLQLQMIDEQNGFLIAKNTSENTYQIYRTQDGWQSYQLIFSTSALTYQMFWLDASNGWVASTSGLYTTHNGGASWELTFTDNPVSAVFFLDATHGWMSSYHNLYFSGDGGQTWSPIGSLPNGNVPSRIHFVDPQNGWCGSIYYQPNSFEARIFRTSDGGQTWQAQYQNSPSFYSMISDLEMLDLQTGYAYITWTDSLLKTTDGGANWNRIASFDEASRFHFIHPDSGWIVGEHGLIYRTTDGGASWQKLFTRDLTSGVEMQFVTEQVGIVGSNSRLYLTQDGGNNWTPVELSGLINQLGSLSALFFRSAQKGWICWDRYIFATADGATSFTQQLDAGHTLRDIYFPTDLSGWAVGDLGTVYHTMNGGATWDAIPELAGSETYFTVFFVDDQNGWIGGTNRTLLRTRDGGLTWWPIPTSNLPPMNINCILFTDTTTGFVGGNGHLLRTTDGGTTWTDLLPVPSFEINRIVVFGNTIIAGGKNSSTWRSMLYISTDGGNTWNRYTGALFTRPIVDLAYTASNSRIFLLGENGELGYLPVSALDIHPIVRELPPTTFYLKPNYPNPFNSETRIPFYLPYTARVEITIFDITGRRVRTLHRGWLSAGWHQLSWDGRNDRGNAVPSGVYFCRMSSAGQQFIRKMALIR